MRRLALWAAATAACAAAAPLAEPGDDAGGAPLPPAPAAGGPAGALLIDGTVHTGTDWSGAPYVGVWGEPFDFRMADYPVTWAIATVHASLLLRSRGIEYGPNAVLSIAIKESRLGCADPAFPNDDGCFQIEDGTAWLELGRLFGARFAAPHADGVAGDRFEASALAAAHYAIFSTAMFRLHADDPEAYFAAHPDPHARQKVLSAAYNRGLWWEQLPVVFRDCKGRDPTECFGGHAIAIDHARAIVDYTVGLDGAPPYDPPLRREDLLAYWDRIRVLYPDVDDAAIRALLEAETGGATLSFQADLPRILGALVAALPPAPTIDDAAAAACGMGYLYGADC